MQSAMQYPAIEKRIGVDGYVIRCGDDHASIWWAGESWSIHEEDALVVPEWQDAKRLMAELRDSHGSTIRTESREPENPESSTRHDDAMAETGGAR